MAQIEVRLGNLGDVDDTVSVYERSNLARRQGDWPSRSARVAQVTASLHDAAGHDASWFLIGREGTEAVAMALIHPFRAGVCCSLLFYPLCRINGTNGFSTRRASHSTRRIRSDDEGHRISWLSQSTF
jgi:hypothetical protein